MVSNFENQAFDFRIFIPYIFHGKKHSRKWLNHAQKWHFALNADVPLTAYSFLVKN